MRGTELSKTEYDVRLRSFRWFLIANSIAVALVVLASLLAYGALSAINQQIPVRSRAVAAFPLVLWIFWWLLTRFGKLARSQTLSEHDLWPRSNAWIVTGWIALGGSLLIGAILVFSYRG
ncbi:MAG: hypothetical protein QOG08_1670 [Chloroflexota bacterium]|jgi:hypothetical protein|nr:hypothetical protein [Chloroflexota bacterium]